MKFNRWKLMNKFWVSVFPHVNELAVNLACNSFAIFESVFTFEKISFTKLVFGILIKYDLNNERVHG